MDDILDHLRAPALYNQEYYDLHIEAADEIGRLRQALMIIAAHARFEQDNPTEMRDTAFSIIEKTARAALPPQERG